MKTDNLLGMVRRSTKTLCEIRCYGCTVFMGYLILMEGRSRLITSGFQCAGCYKKATEPKNALNETKELEEFKKGAYVYHEEWRKMIREKKVLEIKLSEEIELHNWTHDGMVKSKDGWWVDVRDIHQPQPKDEDKVKAKLIPTLKQGAFEDG